MDGDDKENTHSIDLFRNIDLAYSFKKKKLRFIQSASVNREIRFLRDNFQNIFVCRGDRYYLKDPALVENSIELVMGLFGDSDQAEYILNCNLALAALDPERIADFFNKHIASKTARKNLYAILFEGRDSMMELARRQIPYLERYIPTMKKFNTREISTVSLTESDLENFLHFIERFDAIEGNLKKDIQRYRQFERDFLKLYHEDTEVAVVGYGEISTVMRLNKQNHLRHDIVENESRWIWKKMPPFATKSEVDRYLRLYQEYRQILINDVGITVPEQTVRFFRHDAFYMVYAGQERVEELSIGNVLIHKLDEENAKRFLNILLEKIFAVHVFNKNNRTMNIGIDAQLSNWALVSRSGRLEHVTEDDSVTYMDTSSPMIRVQKIEQLNTDIFIKSAASFLRPVLRTFFLQEVLDRYYDFRSVIIDLIANLHKEKRGDLIDCFIGTANRFFRDNGVDVNRITRKEIDDYYSKDAFIWKFYQASRKIDRFITEKIFRRAYMFRIPEKIDR